MEIQRFITKCGRRIQNGMDNGLYIDNHHFSATELRELIRKRDEKGMDKYYKVLRFYRDNKETRTIMKHLTLKEAKEACMNPNTRSDEYFDGIMEE